MLYAPNGVSIAHNILLATSRTIHRLVMPLSSTPRRNMSTPNGTSASPSTPPRKLKILMLHGYTQSGPLFHAKTRALEKALQKAFPASPSPQKPTPGSLLSFPGGIDLLYPSGPRTLSPSDIPGYNPTDLASSTSANDWRAWWQRDSGTGEYVGMEEGFQTIADLIAKEGGIDGVIGFSQGAAAAAFVASLLEPGRVAAFERSIPNGGVSFPGAFLAAGAEGLEKGIVDTINYGTGLKFGVSYSGFYAPDKRYGAFYEPRIKTPMLHFIGSLDSVVEEERSLGLVGKCELARTVVHPGGHFVPIGKEWVAALVGFIRETCGGVERVEKVEENVEDMDMPF